MSQPAEHKPFYEFRRVEARRLLYRLQNELDFRLSLRETAKEKVIDCDELDFLDPTGDVNLSKMKSIQKKQRNEGGKRYPKRNIATKNYHDIKEPGDDEYLFSRMFVSKANNNDLKKYTKGFGNFFSPEVRDLGSEVHQMQLLESNEPISADCTEGKCGSLTEDKEKPHRCSQCNKSFKFKSKLWTHMSIHSAEKTYECSVCGIKFHQSSNRNRHMRIHTGEKPYGCSVCGIKFSHFCSRNSHMRIHTGEKPFDCSVCGLKFRQLSSRNQHTSIHTGEKPYECSVCGIKFRHLGNQKQHVRIHTGEKPFDCSVCGMKFRHSGYRNRHMKSCVL